MHLFSKWIAGAHTLLHIKHLFEVKVETSPFLLRFGKECSLRCGAQCPCWRGGGESWGACEKDGGDSDRKLHDKNYLMSKGVVNDVVEGQETGVFYGMVVWLWLFGLLCRWGVLSEERYVAIHVEVEEKKANRCKQMPNTNTTTPDLTLDTCFYTLNINKFTLKNR